MAEPTVACPNCAQPNPPRAKFCLECGSEMAPAVARAGREERKVVSVLFADLVGFTSQAEQLDPEEVRAILAPYHARLREELELFGGTVEKFIGDAVMALFGAPVAHEDDAERAVRAALSIRQALLEDGRLHVRIGVTTGEALVALDARPESGEGMASGDVVNSASRLQTQAPVDGILVDEPTYRSTRRAIEYDDHPPVQVKGKVEPIAVHLAVAAQARFGSDVQQHGPQMVGRQTELQLMTGAVERAIGARQPQLVTLVGVPGIGKSRLVWELFQHVDRDERLVTWRQGRCLPYAESISYWALGEIVKAEAGILETDTLAAAQRKVQDSVVELIGQSRDADWVTRHLGMLVGAKLETELHGDHRGEAFAAWRMYLEALAERRPTVLVVEDLHWADDGLLDFVDQLVDWATGVPLLVVCTARPELLSRRQGWGGGKTNATTISLAPLTDAETRTLVASLVEQALIPVSVSDAVLERAQGNPLYAEEFARLVAERGHVDDLPESVQGIIAARLDGLTRDEKELLQDAAVVGKVFWGGALSAMREISRSELEQHMHALERKEFVRRDRRSALADETEYSFRHILVRDVAYGQIPRADRADRHTRVAAWIENLGRPAEHAELLAGHRVAALELIRATGRPADDHAEHALQALLRAGERALGLNAFAGAARHLGAALDLMADDDPRRPMALFGHGKALRVSEERGADELAAAEASLRRAGNREVAAEAAVLLAELAWFSGDGELSRDHLGRAAETVAELPSSPSKAFVLSSVARFHMLRAEHAQAIEAGRQALAIAEQLGLEDIRAHALNNIGTARHDGGDLGGIDDLLAALEIATASKSREVARVLINLAAAYWRDGDMKQVNATTVRAVEAAREFGDRSAERFARSAMPDIHFGRGEWDEALAMLDEQITEAEDAGGHVSDGQTRITRSRIRLARGDVEAAISDATIAVERAFRAGDPQTVIPALGYRIWLHATLGDGTDLEALATELLEQPGVGENSTPDIVAVLPVELDRLAKTLLRLMPGGWRRDVVEQVHRGHFAEAAVAVSEAEDEPTAALIRLEGARQLIAAGRAAEAVAELDKARSFWTTVGATFFLARSDELLARAHQLETASS